MDPFTPLLIISAAMTEAATATNVSVRADHRGRRFGRRGDTDMKMDPFTPLLIISAAMTVAFGHA
jgi:hypothetical protein